MLCSKTRQLRQCPGHARFSTVCFVSEKPRVPTMRIGVTTRPHWQPRLPLGLLHSLLADAACPARLCLPDLRHVALLLQTAFKRQRHSMNPRGGEENNDAT